MDNQDLREKKSKAFDYKWVIIGVCALVICLGLGFCSSTKGIFLPKILAGTGLERGPFGISDTFRYVTTAVVNIFFGTLVIKLGVKLLMGLGFIALIGSMVLYGAATELWQFYTAGYALGSPLMGFVFDVFGSYVPAFYAGSALMFITVVIMQFVITSANKERARIESELALQQEIA